jgi:hypothetical protein
VWALYDLGREYLIQWADDGQTFPYAVYGRVADDPGKIEALCLTM